jgi:hypothetical protein
MQSSTPQGKKSGASGYGRQVRRRFRTALGLLALTTLFAVAQEAPPGAVLRPWEPPDAVSIPNKNDQMRMQQEQQDRKKTNYAAANLERQKQIAADTAKLVELANELKNDVDKTDKDTLSISVIRKAEMIEKLAKGVKEKMKLTAAAR